MSTDDSIKVEGSANDLPVISTGLWSIDHLLSYRGLPGYRLRTITELYAYEGVGKTTFSMYLAGRCLPDGTILLADLEGGGEYAHIESSLKRAGFHGTIKVLDIVDKKGKPRAHEEILQEAADGLLTNGVSSCIIDSIGAIIPRAEAANDIGDANMGQRARLMAQLSRRLMNNLRVADGPKTAILINHVHEVMGGRGHDTPGGVTKKYAAGTRLMMYRKEVFANGSAYVEVRCEKRRYGGVIPGARGGFVIIPAWGVSPEMSAVFDCLEHGLATRDKAGYIRIDGDSVGRLGKLFEASVSNDLTIFEQFHALLKTATPVEEEENDEE